MANASSNERSKQLSIGGALLAALAASSCCLGPLLLAALGIGGAGATAALAAYRPYVLWGTALLLTAGFYIKYRERRTAAGDACGCERPRSTRPSASGLRRSDIPKQVVTVTYEPSPGRLAAYVAAIHDLDYEADAVEGSEARR